MTHISLLDRLEAPARVSDTERLYRRLQSANGPVPMPTLRLEFLGCLTQRVSDLRRELRPRGLDVKNEKKRVNGKLHSTYELVTQ